MAALRGHEVILYERTDRLGGQGPAQCRGPQARIHGRHHPLAGSPGRAGGGGGVRLGSAASVETVLAAQPDAVIVATGSRPYRPDLPGFAAPHVVTSWEVLSGAVETGQRRVDRG